MTPAWMTAPKDATFVFLTISWGEQGDEDWQSFGPYVVKADGSHLEQVQFAARTWRDSNPQEPNMAVHLFACSPVPAAPADVKAAYDAMREDVARVIRPRMQEIYRALRDGGNT